VNPFGGWLRNAGVASGAAIERPDLWLAASLGSVISLGWLPLVLTVAALPRASDLAFLGAGLLGSSLYPWNVLLLAAAATLLVLGACLLAGLAEAALLRAAGHGTPGRSLTRETEATFSVLLIAWLPVVAVATALISGIAAVAPVEFGAPDIGGPLALRILGHFVPLVVALVGFVLIGQAFGATALRRAVGAEAVPVGAALRGALIDLLARPLRRLGTALASTLIALGALTLATILLGLLWAPIQVELAGGRLVGARALLLLVGFVAVWLALVLAFGALHAWVSGWWSLELGHAGEGSRPTLQEANP
jgi:hypothetical protein